jgi:hypothetical protein
VKSGTTQSHPKRQTRCREALGRSNQRRSGLVSVARFNRHASQAALARWLSLQSTLGCDEADLDETGKLDEEPTCDRGCQKLHRSEALFTAR